MLVHRTYLLLSFVVLANNMYLTKAADDVDASDKELLAKLFSVVFKCFKDADWNTCGEMLTTKYDITQQKYKQCTCHMACAGEELGMINNNGEPNPPKFLEYVNKVNSKSIKTQMQNIYDKCQTVKGAEKCDLAEKFAICAFTESPVLKERAAMLIETITKMKSN